MLASSIIFYILATVIVVFSILAVTSRRIIRAAVYLLFVLLGTAGLYLLLDYQFLMAVQIAVYAGGIMVLFIFAILLTHQPGKDVKLEKPKRMFVALVASFAGLVICGHIIFHNVRKLIAFASDKPIDMHHIGMTLLGTDKYQYLLPFEAISVLLLACIIGGLMIARKR